MSGSTQVRHPKDKTDASLAPASSFLWALFDSSVGAKVIVALSGLGLVGFTVFHMIGNLKMFQGPIFEVHISNIHRRDALHQHSIMSSVATGVLAGLGADGYRAAVEAMVRRLDAG